MDSNYEVPVMTTSDQEDQAEKRRALLNDARVRDQSQNGDTGTFLSHAHIDDAGGRFAAVNAAKVVGQSPGIAAQYPAASAAHQTELPPEEPLGYRVDAMPELESSMAIPVSSSVEATDDPAHAPSSDGGPATSSGGLVCERAGSSPSSSTMAAQCKSQMSSSAVQVADVGAERPPSHQDDDNDAA
jgi:hypothetical protein